MAKDLTEREYWKEIKALAEAIVDETAEERGEERSADLLDAAFEKAHEVVDGHEWIIYYAYNLDVIKHTRNEDAWEDLGLEQFEGKSFRDICTVVAFWAMLRDVEAEISEILE
jgi:hypothetical protein